MRYGRLTQTAWQRSVRRELHKRGKDVLFGPSPWEECSGIKDGGGGAFLWANAHTAGNSAHTGYYAVLQAAGELAAKGARAVCVSVRILFPPEAEEEDLKAVTEGIEDACGRMDLQVTSFQGETSCASEQIIVFVTAAGRTDEKNGQDAELTGQSGVEEHKKHKAAGQEIVFCGYAGLEGMLRILDEAEDELGTRFVPDFLRKAKDLKDRLVTPGQILPLFDAGVTAVFQAGSGGVLAALWEMAETLRVGFDADMSEISIRQETVEICEFYRLNPYQMASSGSWLIVTEDAPRTIEVLEKAGARAGRLGVAKAQNARVITSGEEVRYLDRPAPDELELWLAGRKQTDLR